MLSAALTMLVACEDPFFDLPPSPIVDAGSPDAAAPTCVGFMTQPPIDLMGAHLTGSSTFASVVADLPGHALIITNEPDPPIIDLDAAAKTIATSTRLGSPGFAPYSTIRDGDRLCFGGHDGTIRCGDHRGQHLVATSSSAGEPLEWISGTSTGAFFAVGSPGFFNRFYRLYGGRWEVLYAPGPLGVTDDHTGGGVARVDDDEAYAVVRAGGCKQYKHCVLHYTRAQGAVEEQIDVGENGGDNPTAVGYIPALQLPVLGTSTGYVLQKPIKDWIPLASREIFLYISNRVRAFAPYDCGLIAVTNAEVYQWCPALDCPTLGFASADRHLLLGTVRQVAVVGPDLVLTGAVYGQQQAQALLFVPVP
jgi:hypothetical protein